ncbi:hypothetical protein GCM10027347_51350 [Larkinella harenae]
MALQIEHARPDDRQLVISLLQQADLLTDDLPADLGGFLVAREQGALTGVAGLDRFGPVALLRSVAVDPRHQGKQIGAHLVGRLLNEARAGGLEEMYLITTTAEHYFERHGFQPVARPNVPLTIQHTQQFSELCPSSAVVMMRPL